MASNYIISNNYIYLIGTVCYYVFSIKYFFQVLITICYEQMYKKFQRDFKQVITLYLVTIRMFQKQKLFKLTLYISNNLSTYKWDLNSYYHSGLELNWE